MSWSTAREGMSATTTSGIGLYGAQQEALAKKSARQGLTPPADATLVLRHARGEQVARDPGPARTEVGRVCVRGM